MTEPSHDEQVVPEAEEQETPAPQAEEPPVDEPAEVVDPLTAAQQALSERTNDLQRLQAEFVNYKRRVERDRDLIRQNATYAALAPIAEVLDTIDRAREHGAARGRLPGRRRAARADRDHGGPDQVRRARRRVRPEPARR